MRDVQGNVVDNRYDVVQPLGSGGMGEVYLARDRVLGRDVALKILRSQYAKDQESADRFKREAQSAASLSHPNIVQVYDRGDTEEGSSYIAMEYVPGGTLKDRISREGTLRPELAASFGYQVAEALGAAHAKGIVHRDIKPQNVLITENGEAKVTDFGIARAVSAATGSQTDTGTILGTAGYMSPEQALGQPATQKSDLYSLGVVLYEALTGELPFTADNPVAVSMKHVNETPYPPNEVNPAVPDNLNAIVIKLLAKDPNDRYAGADDLAEDLWLARRGAFPESTTAPRETYRSTRATPTTRQAAPRRKRRFSPLILLSLLLLFLGLAGLAYALSGTLGGSSGASVEIPSVEGLPRDEAVAELENAGLRSEVETRESSTSERGTVLAQSPPGGESVSQGEAVALTVGGGPGTVAVPEVEGLGLSEARSVLEGAGLTVGFRRRIQDELPAGVVVAQGVPAGDEVDPGTAVALDVSTGPPQPTTPSSASASPNPEPTTETSAPPAASTSAAAEGGQGPPGGNGPQGNNAAQEQAPPSASPSGASPSGEDGGGGEGEDD